MSINLKRPFSSLNLFIAGFFALVILIIIVTVFSGKQVSPSSTKTTRELALSCTRDELTKFHIHPHLEIIIEGKSIEIPKDIGISPSCLSVIHTHDNTGLIHIESPEKRDFTLSDFFAVWKKDFSQDKILDFETKGQYLISVEVNGQAVESFENTILKDQDRIVIEFHP